MNYKTPACIFIIQYTMCTIHCNNNDFLQSERVKDHISHRMLVHHNVSNLFYNMMYQICMGSMQHMCCVVSSPVTSLYYPFCWYNRNLAINNFSPVNLLIYSKLSDQQLLPSLSTLTLLWVYTNTCKCVLLIIMTTRYK